ncbi:hypothetical protein V1264_022848 [Littorina saxatilis]|uniref:Uncharacterized protein n=1 Tax=Littorina saxatilis TaxID=31220 RepID=A0AAN9B6Y5_9CAEN
MDDHQIPGTTDHQIPVAKDQGVLDTEDLQILITHAQQSPATGEQKIPALINFFEHVADKEEIEGPDSQAARSLGAQQTFTSLETSLDSLTTSDLTEAMTDMDISQQVENIKIPLPSLLHSFDANIRGQTSAPLLYDVTMTASGTHVIVTDSWNHCIKAFDLRLDGCPCTGVLHMKEEVPLCMSKLSSPERLVCTLHQRSEIYVINVDDNEGGLKSSGDKTLSDDKAESNDKTKDKTVSNGVLLFNSAIAVTCLYRGVSTLPPVSGVSEERLVLTTPKEIHIVSLQGQLLQIIAPTLCGLPLLNDAIYITSTPSNDMVVADVGARRVLCFKPSGRLRWFHPSQQATDEEKEGKENEGDNGKKDGAAFRGIRWPLGVGVDEEGRVMVCDLELHSVVLLSPGGAASRLLLTEKQSLQFPRGLCIRGRCLCITQNDSVKVFRM